MRRRFQTSNATGGEERLAAPRPGRSLSVWWVGVLVAMTCLWLAQRDTIWLLPAVLAAGALALRAGSRAEWLWWVPAAVVGASVLEVVTPLAGSRRWGDLHHVELLAIAIVVVGLVRAIAREETPRTRTLADRPLAALLGLYAATLLIPGTASDPWRLTRDAMTMGVVFFATVAIANRGGARWAWLAFPAAAGLAGLLATWAAFSDPKGVAGILSRIDAAWRTTGGVWFTLLVSVPLGFGLAMKAHPQALRHLCTVLVNLGVMGAIALFFTGARPAVDVAVPDRPADLARSVLLAAALAGLAAHAEWNRRTQPEPSRWLVLAAIFSLSAAGVLVGLPLGGPAGLLLAIAAGLVVGVPQEAPRDQSVAVPQPVEASGPVPVSVRAQAPAPAPAGLPATAPARPAANLAPARSLATPAPALAVQAPVRVPESDAVAPPAGEFHPQTLISVVIVAHRALGALGPCLSSLAAARLSVPMEVVVVDNDSCDGTLDWIRREHPWVGTIASSTNVGFARGVNLGVTEACGDLLLLLNPHCEVSAEALEAMCETASRTPALAAVAPMLLDHRGRLTRSCGRFPDLWTLGCDHFGLSRVFPRSRWFARHQYGERPIDSLDQVDWASAACLLIPRAAWDAVGALDESMFLYLEEVDWCRRAARTGRNVRFVPAARIVHHGSMSSKPVPGDSYPNDLRSSVLYFRKHYGGPMAVAVKAVLLTSLAIKWGVSSMRVTSRPLANLYARGVTTVWMA